MMAILARRLGCTEGRAYTVTIGFTLALLLAVNAIPPLVEPAQSATPAVTHTERTAPDRSSTPEAPTTTLPALPTGGTNPVVGVQEPAVAPPRPAPSPPVTPRVPGYVLPAELRPLEAAVGNLVAEGCSRVGLANVVVSFFPRDTPIPARDLLVVLTPLYLTCGQFAFPETHIECDVDRQVAETFGRLPLLPIFLSAPPVLGLAVEAATAPTDTALGVVGLSDPLLKPSLLTTFGCHDVAQ